MEHRETITWPGWETVGVIGRGTFGTVYEIRRDMLGDMERAALKHISIPSSENEIESLMSEGLDAASITKTFRDQLNDIVEEYKLMRKLNDCPYVVRCDDVQFAQKEDGSGWDILIRMELLTPLTKVLGKEANVPEERIIALGTDVSRALIRCEENNILHRDIKIQNIFVSEDGKYKLGDFGIAKAKERTSTGTARIGTYDYMAPEVYWGKSYDHTADIYSLGMVLYWLLNNRCMPFHPQTSPAPPMHERDAARMRRLNGEQLPPPVNGNEALKRIVLKCCAFRPNDRYPDGNALFADLLALRRPATYKKERGTDPSKKRSPAHGQYSFLNPRKAFKVIASVLLLGALVFSGWKLKSRGILRGMPNEAEKPAPTQDIVTPAPTTPPPTATPKPDARMLYNMGEDCYAAGKYSEALKYYIESAEAGNAQAMTAIGRLYKNAQGVAQDYENAMMWFRKAADAGDGDAMAEIGFLYLDGRGVKKDYEAALRYFYMADQAGITEVLYPLGEMFEEGTGVNKDLTIATQWYIKAANAGNTEAKKKLGKDPLKSIAKALDTRTYLCGVTGEIEPLFTLAYPIYLEKPVKNLRKIAMVLTIQQWKSGWPYGNWYLLARDEKDNWNPAAIFRLDSSQGVGQTKLYTLDLDNDGSITALAICPADNGVDFSVEFEIYFFAPEENIGEFSRSLPQPTFTPLKQKPVLTIHAPQDGYSLPWFIQPDAAAAEGDSSSEDGGSEDGGSEGGSEGGGEAND